MTGKADRRTTDRRRSNASPTVERRNASDRRSNQRRHSVRAPMDLWVEEEHGEDLYFRRVGNLSVGGVFFENAIPHKTGTRVTVKFSVPGHERIIETQAEVVNTTPGKAGVGMGVRFVGLHEEDRNLISSYIDAVNNGFAPSEAEEAG